MKKEQEARRSRRFEVEGDVHVKVLFTKSNDLKSVKAKLKNAGLGGLFIETKDLFEEGALADLSMELADGSLANTLGLIRWIKPGKGIGIEFFYGSEEERDALERYIAAWAAGEQPRDE